MGFIEGDFIETTEGLIFEVRGHVHPPEAVVAYLRYYPSEAGDRERSGVKYAKAGWVSERLAILRERYPQYLRFDPYFNDVISCVPLSAVKKAYRPRDALASLAKEPPISELEHTALALAELVSRTSCVPLSSIGLGGSLCVGLHSAESDIDLVVYGERNCRAVYATLGDLRAAGELKPLEREYLEGLYMSSQDDTPMPKQVFLFHEARKLSCGIFRGVNFSVRFVLEASEVSEKYGSRIYRPLGTASLHCTIADSSLSIFTPCRYGVTNVEFIEGPSSAPLIEIVSYRARFAEYATEGERVFARGRLEEVTEGNRRWLRLVLTGGGDTMYVVRQAT